MSVRTKTIAVISLILVVLIGATYFISQNYLMDSFGDIEKDTAQQNLDRIRNLIDDEISDLNDFSWIWASWDKTDEYVFTENVNPDFIDSYLTDEVFIEQRLTLMMFFSSSNELVYHKLFDIVAKKEIHVNKSVVEEYIADYTDEGILTHNHTESLFSGIAMSQYGPMLISSRPIVSFEENELICGYVVVGRDLNSLEIERLGNIAQLPFTIESFDDPTLNDEFEDARSSLSKDDSSFIKPLNKDTVSGYALLNDIRENPLLIIRADMPRDIYIQGQNTIDYFLFSLLAGGLAVCILISLLMDRLVLRRLAHLNRSVSRIGESSYASARIKVSGNDEFSNLSIEVNNMLDTIQTHTDELRAANSELRSIQKQILEANEQLQESERNLNKAQQIAHVGSWEWNIATDQFMISTEMSRLYGIGENARIMDIHSMIDGSVHPDDKERIFRALKDVTANGYGQVLVFRITRPNGEVRWIEASPPDIKSKDGNGSPLIVMGTIQDITQRKEAEEALSESEKKYRELADLLPQTIFELDLEGTATYINRYGIENYGYTQADIDEGLNCFDIIVPEDRQRLLQSLADMVAGNSRDDSEYTIEKKNGDTVPVLIYGDLVHDQDQPVGVRGVMVDISERKKAEQAISQKNRELFTLNAVLQQVTQSLDLEEILSIALDKTMLMLDIENAGVALVIEGDEYLDLRIHRGADRQMLQELPRMKIGEGNLGRVAQSGEPMFIETLANSSGMMYENSEEIVKENNLKSAMFLPLKAKGKVLGVMFGATKGERVFTSEERELLAAVGHGISTAIENAQLLEIASRALALEETDRLRAAFLASISHEIRTPLTSIKGMAETLVQPDVEWDSETQKEFLITISGQSDRLVHIVTDVLDMSTIEADAMKLYTRKTKIGEIIRSVDGLLNDLAANHHLELKVPDNLAGLVADTVRIGQVFTNLVENAAAYSPPGSIISITAQESDDELIVSVADNGEGIPHDQLELIFSNFYRIEENTERKTYGSGLGLAISQGIVTMHGGKMWAESEGVGKGTTIKFTLPCTSRRVKGI